MSLYWTQELNFSPPSTESNWGLRLAGTRDPSGNIFYFVEYVDG